MFIIDLNYIVPLDELDVHMADHVKYLRKYYRKNIFVASGRKVPRTGGIILALADDAATMNKIICEDPFYKYELAEFTVIEFLTSQYHPDLKTFLER
ncbi:YciI family protein [Mucilaginibacter boryungensis]|uniref:GTP cyclohydrolase n=1 Tax=Mucilaginibacter boryungensis TaxID=768480 RepID=A0ABR9XIJ7_9SPHI|nr:YciI family protein [Mucilaginibacter boryungensis]MBE9667202.1 GTP cyclohydrolase [Mucilaginibacter boryungensis]